MKIINKINRLIERPARLPIGLQLRYAHIFGDQTALIKALYWMEMGVHLNLTHPKTFTEKIQWLKLNDHREVYHQMVDKYKVKDYVANLIGNEYIIPTLGVWDSFDDIDFHKLPDQFVIKTTSGGGSSGVIICKDKSKLDINEARKKIKQSAQNDIYKSAGEWAYKDVKARIIVEEFLADDSVNKCLTDYKFYCFNGKPLYCQVIRDRNKTETIDFYDMQWNHMPFVGLNPQAQNGIVPVSKPEKLGTMINICSKLSHGIPFCRVDLYVVRSNVFFGEITFYPSSGFGTITPQEWNHKLGDLLQLPNI